MNKKTIKKLMAHDQYNLVTVNHLIRSLTGEEYKKLRDNYEFNDKLTQEGQEPKDFPAVVKFFNPQGAGTWFISELSPDNIGYGLCHIFEYEIGNVCFDELASFRGHFGLPIEKDRHFYNGRLTLSELKNSLDK